jgi:hypothetical protein
MGCWREKNHLRRCADVCRDCPACRVKDATLLDLARRYAICAGVLARLAERKRGPRDDDTWDEREPVNVPESRQ